MVRIYQLRLPITIEKRLTIDNLAIQKAIIKSNVFLHYQANLTSVSIALGSIILDTAANSKITIRNKA